MSRSVSHFIHMRRHPGLMASITGQPWTTGTRMPKHPGFCCSRWCRWCKCRSKLLRCAKLQWHHHINIPTFSFYRLVAVRATQPAVSRHLRKVSVYTTVNIERYACHLMSHTSLLELACTDWFVRYGCLRNTTENVGFFGQKIWVIFAEQWRTSDWMPNLQSMKPFNVMLSLVQRLGCAYM